MSENLFGITDLGRQRQNNEDTFIADVTANERHLIGCVIDGVGGYSGGEIAAEIARDTITEQLHRLSGDVMAALAEAIKVANQRIWQERTASGKHGRMACVLTLAVADLNNNQFYFAHLGDTRLYLFRDGSLVKISHDQSFVGFLEDSGRLTESEAMRHPKRNEIDKALGFKEDINPVDDMETGQSPFLPGDLLLLCSDGLTDVVDKSTITAILNSPESLESIGKALIDAANHGGGKDNITVVLLKNDKKGQQHQPTKPIETVPMTKQPTTKNVNKPATSTVPEKNRPRTYGGWAIFFAILAIGLGALCAMQYFNGAGAWSVKHADSSVVMQKPRNAQEVKLLTAISQAKGKLVILSDTEFKTPIIFTRPLVINQDSLHIKAKGNIVFLKDSALKESAFILTTTTKNIILDSVTFENFGVAISGRGQSLQLRNVRFKDCIVPVENSFILNDSKYINGNLTIPIFKADDAPVKTK
jgi:serine/threonine protein phosphatase PrpC